MAWEHTNLLSEHCVHFLGAVHRVLSYLKHEKQPTEHHLKYHALHCIAVSRKSVLHY